VGECDRAQPCGAARLSTTLVSPPKRLRDARGVSRECDCSRESRLPCMGDLARLGVGTASRSEAGLSCLAVRSVGVRRRFRWPSPGLRLCSRRQSPRRRSPAGVSAVRSYVTRAWVECSSDPKGAEGARDVPDVPCCASREPAPTQGTKLALASPRRSRPRLIGHGFGPAAQDYAERDGLQGATLRPAGGRIPP